MYINGGLYGFYIFYYKFIHIGFLFILLSKLINLENFEGCLYTTHSNMYVQCIDPYDDDG